MANMFLALAFNLRLALEQAGCGRFDHVDPPKRHIYGKLHWLDHQRMPKKRAMTCL